MRIHFIIFFFLYSYFPGNHLFYFPIITIAIFYPLTDSRSDPEQRYKYIVRSTRQCISSATGSKYCQGTAKHWNNNARTDIATGETANEVTG